MSIAGQSTQQKFPFPYDAVFDGLVAVIPRIGFTLKSQDRVIGRITSSTGVSMWSWGENLAMIVEKIDDNSALVGIESTLKLALYTGIRNGPSQNADARSCISEI